MYTINNAPLIVIGVSSRYGMLLRNAQDILYLVLDMHPFLNLLAIKRITDKLMGLSIDTLVEIHSNSINKNKGGTRKVIKS